MKLQKQLQLLLALFIVGLTPLSAQESQPDSSWMNEYRATAEKVNDLIHTKLEANFLIPQSQMIGKVWITLQPHFYPTDSLKLDAKAMEIKEVSIVNGATKQNLKYDYDGLVLNIRLNKMYKGGEKYTIYIHYIAKPNEYKAKGSAAITGAKGLYFINPEGKEKNKPTQFWTQGETEGTSVWCPTIDRPNQKSTQDFYLTVPAKWVTLSNGKLVSSKPNANGTKTDNWKMDLPHAPYLFFVGAGDFAVIKEMWKTKELSYYVDKEYATVAKKIFGETPRMMSFFSNITGVEYPWVKYGQMVAHDYVSGAMENTTATLHQESAQQNARELVDGNAWESVIAHELFHHWFGDLVTAESWSNLTVNESFANYSEYLWYEHRYGKDKADEHHLQDMQGYFSSGSQKKHLVRFYYPDKEEMFDAVSYNKGGRILHMLRNFLGDAAFFKGLNNYLTTNKFKAAEAHQLRLAFEEVSGKDLNWFFNQWYFGAGHPALDIQYSYQEAEQRVMMVVKQTQQEKIFTLPVAVDVYHGSKKQRHSIWITKATDTFYFAASSKPDLVNFDGDKVLLCTKKENKTIDEYIHQYTYAGKYLDRKEAIDYVTRNQKDAKAVAFMQLAVNDKFEGLRALAIERANLKNHNISNALLTTIENAAEKDAYRTVRAKAIDVLGNLKNQKYKSLFSQAIADSSYTVSGSALAALAKIDEAAATEQAMQLIKTELKGKVLESVLNMIIKTGDVNYFDMIADAYNKLGLTQAKFQLTSPFADLISKINETSKVKLGVDLIVEFRDAIPAQFGLGPVFDGMLKGIIHKKEEALKTASNATTIQEQIDYIKSKLLE